jgi:hypothetical protein
MQAIFPDEIYIDIWDEDDDENVYYNVHSTLDTIEDDPDEDKKVAIYKLVEVKDFVLTKTLE